MNNFNDLKKEIKSLDGSLLLIGEFDNRNFPLDNSRNIQEIFYLNGNAEGASDSEISTKNIASNMHLRELHKYFKDGVDNIYCNFDEINKHIPSFIRESLRITKKNIYIIFSNKNSYKKIEKKYKRYKINCNLYSFDNINIAVIEANDIIVPFFKESYYYIIDRIEATYNDISENI